MGEGGDGGKREVRRPSSPQFSPVYFRVRSFEISWIRSSRSLEQAGLVCTSFVFAYSFELSFRYLIQFCVQLISAEIV